MPMKNINGRIKVSELLNLRKFGRKLVNWIKKFSKSLHQLWTKEHTSRNPFWKAYSGEWEKN